MNVLLATLGSHGDIHPFIAVGAELRRRAHRVALLTNPFFHNHATAAGLVPLPLGESIDPAQLIAGAPTMHRWRGPFHVMRRLTLPHVPAFISATQRAIADFRPDAALVHLICFGVPWVLRLHGVPLAMASLSPLPWMNPADPLVMNHLRPLHPTPRQVRRDAWLARLVVRWALDRELNRCRASLGLPPMRGVMLRDSIGGDINLGLWSPVLRPALPGDPRNSTVCGTPWWDADHAFDHNTSGLDRFLSSGPPPIVFTLGTTGVHTAGRFYHHATEACRTLNRRAVMLIGRDHYAEHLLPANLPSTIHTCSYAPYSTLLPRGACTVHHGGVGSTAQALRAGRPTVVVPMAHDQFDNAARVSGIL